jgi:hypothetical protein
MTPNPDVPNASLAILPKRRSVGHYDCNSGRSEHGEEREILTRIRRGERIEHFETIRQRKHGSLINVSLTVSPVRNAEGKIVGASKIARDITQQKRDQEKITTLAREAEHRSKNLLASGRDAPESRPMRSLAWPVVSVRAPR